MMRDISCGSSTLRSIGNVLIYKLKAYGDILTGSRQPLRARLLDGGGKIVHPSSHFVAQAGAVGDLDDVWRFNNVDPARNHGVDKCGYIGAMPFRRSKCAFQG